MAALVRRFQKPASHISKIADIAQLAALLVSALNLVFSIGMGLVLFQADFWELFFGLPATIALLLLIPPTTTGLTPGLVFFAFLAWKQQYGSLRGRIYYSLIALASCGFVSVLIEWNLLGIQL